MHVNILVVNLSAYWQPRIVVVSAIFVTKAKRDGGNTKKDGSNRHAGMHHSTSWNHSSVIG